MSIDAHTRDQLRSLRLDGMLAAIDEQATHSAAATLNFEQRFVMLVQREIDWRDDKRLTRLLKAAKLKVATACIEDIDWRASRGLDRALIASLANGDWLRHAHNVLITGATGVGKTWLACALAQQAARSGFSVLYARAPRLLEELRIAHGDGSFGKRLGQLSRLDLLVLDDFAIAPIALGERNDLLEPSSPASFRSTPGTSGSTIPRWPTPSSIALCTLHIRSRSRASRCARNPPNLNRAPSRPTHFKLIVDDCDIIHTYHSRDSRSSVITLNRRPRSI
jgi:DNA replication protein DnaC